MLLDIHQLFERRQIRPNGIAHFGSSSGQERFTYAKYCPNGPVVWVEALPDVYAQLRANVAGWPTHVAINACLGDEDGKRVTFHRASNEGQSSSFLEFGTHAISHPTVHFVDDTEMVMQRADTLLAARGIEMPYGSFLNVDCQGADLLVLKGMGDLLNRFDFCHIEINEAEVYKGCALANEVFEYLAKFGFKVVEKAMFGNAMWGDCYLHADRSRTPRTGDK